MTVDVGSIKCTVIICMTHNMMTRLLCIMTNEIHIFVTNENVSKVPHLSCTFFYFFTSIVIDKRMN